LKISKNPTSSPTTLRDSLYFQQDYNIVFDTYCRHCHRVMHELNTLALNWVLLYRSSRIHPPLKSRYLKWRRTSFHH